MELFSYEMVPVIDAFFDDSEEKPFEDNTADTPETLEANNSDDMIVLEDGSEKDDDFIIHSEEIAEPEAPTPTQSVTKEED